MNKNEQSQLCMLLAKLRYDLMELSFQSNFARKQYEDTINAINKIMSFSFIDGDKIKKPIKIEEK